MARRSAGGARPLDRGHGGRLRPPPRKWRLLTVFFRGLLVFLALVGCLAFWQLHLMRDPGRDPDSWNPRRRPHDGVLRFVPSDLMSRLRERGGLVRLRYERRFRGIRPPRLALVAGTTGKDPQSLMLLTLVKGLKELGYTFTVFDLGNREARPLWERVGCQVSTLNSESSGSVDWSNFEGLILSSLEAKPVISSLMQEPFDFIPVIWLVQEDSLGKRLSSYEALGQTHLIDMWRSAFSRADVVVFPDYFLPILYSSLDTGNFFVISSSPVDVWATKSYSITHSHHQLRADNGFSEDELIVLIIGSYFFYEELPWDYAATMLALAKKVTRSLDGTVKFILLCGNSTETHGSDFQELASHMRFPDGSIKHYGMDSDVNSLLLMADILLYASFKEEQSFPPLLVRAMSFGVPIVVPDCSIIKKYVVEKVHGLFFRPAQPDTLAEVFSLLISDKKLSELAHTVAHNGKLLSENMLASDCITYYAKLLEDVLQFPSDVVLPGPIPQIQQNIWAWDLLEQNASNLQHDETSINKDLKIRPSIVDVLERQLMNETQVQNGTQGEPYSLTTDFLTELDWSEITEIEISEDIERREIQEHEERMEKNSGSWDEVYRNTRKAEKKNFEANERDEGELERTGQSLCIYEIYNGEGTWPFLHHGSLYRGISLLKQARRPRSDDVDAVGRLPILNDTYYKDLLCELGAMFSVANKVDNIHKTPWIGFQSWRVAGRNVSLSNKAEDVLGEVILDETKGDTFFYWALMDADQKDNDENNNIDFWSFCDILNAGRCRVVFEETFRQMYGLPADFAAVPPMPNDGEKWSTLHSWVMPTPSFLEFVMFSRMFVDSLHSLNQNTRNPTLCTLGSSQFEKRHCYCRLLEVLVNVWAYHSGRRMVYLNPLTGEVQEQHPLEQRKGLMWVKYFSPKLLKGMDEDLAQEADDGTHLSERWLWPLTGEVSWQGILDREKESKYRRKMDKKRKMKEKLLDRQKHGYKQKPIGTNRNP